MIPFPLGMFDPSKCGGIVDLGLGISWDAARFGDEISRRAAVLAQMGIARGSIVAIGHGGTARFFADLFATWAVGAAAACLDASLTPGELQTVVNFAKSAVLLVDGAASVEQLSVPIVDLGSQRCNSFSAVASSYDPDDPALVLFTSGTTGAPKGVVLSFRALQARISANIAAIGAPTLARALVSLPTHFGHGLIGNSLTPLLAGGNIVLHPIGIPMASDLGRIIDQHRITFMSSVPTLWQLALTRSARPFRSSLVRVHVGSAPFSASLWSEVVEWSGAEVVNCYGTTETANWIAGASSRTDCIADGLLGKMWGGSAAVLDENGSVNHTGIGEIIIQSPSLMSGYLDRPDLTAAAFHQGWYRTGDRGSIDQQGRLWLTGRIKDEINRAGFKVQPAEIDALLESHPAIAEACVFGISDPLGGEAIGAAVRLAKGASADPQSLQAWCRERLRRDAVPERWFIVSEIPRNARGKVSRDAVRRSLITKSSTEASEADLSAPAQSVQDRVAGVRTAVERAWTEILGHDSYIADVPLVQAGGDSLDAMRMWLIIEKILGTKLSMDVIASDPTSSQLTAAIEQELHALSANSHPGRAGTRLIFLMPPAGGDSLKLVRFRTALKNKIRFVVIEYPSWRELANRGVGFDTLVDSAVAQIRGQTGENETCLLLGYSFGGLVAMETARRLADRGRQVGLVGLIDTRAAYAAIAQPKGWRLLIAGLASINAFRSLKVIGQLATLLPSKWAIDVEFALNERLRATAWRSWRQKPLGIPVTMYKSEETSPDDGWSAQCNQLEVVPIGGAHDSILEPPYLHSLCKRILETVEPVPIKATNSSSDMHARLAPN
jgi:oxalate---CoA ligase